MALGVPTVTLCWRRNASHFWIMLLLISGPTDHEWISISLGDPAAGGRFPVRASPHRACAGDDHRLSLRDAVEIAFPLLLRGSWVACRRARRLSQYSANLDGRKEGRDRFVVLYLVRLKQATCTLIFGEGRIRTAELLPRCRQQMIHGQVLRREKHDGVCRFAVNVHEAPPSKARRSFFSASVKRSRSTEMAVLPQEASRRRPSTS